MDLDKLKRSAIKLCAEVGTVAFAVVLKQVLIPKVEKWLREYEQSYLKK